MAGCVETVVGWEGRRRKKLGRIADLRHIRLSENRKVEPKISHRASRQGNFPGSCTDDPSLKRRGCKHAGVHFHAQEARFCAVSWLCRSGWPGHDAAGQLHQRLQPCAGIAAGRTDGPREQSGLHLWATPLASIGRKRDRITRDGATQNRPSLFLSLSSPLSSPTPSPLISSSSLSAHVSAAFSK
ncbi:hypothetical protein L1887_48592 [Cichorium endivia]|nr:hypothetical protein L1887_48592 [Cichorium endivia]